MLDGRSHAGAGHAACSHWSITYITLLFGAMALDVLVRMAVIASIPGFRGRETPCVESAPNRRAIDP